MKTRGVLFGVLAGLMGVGMAHGSPARAQVVESSMTVSDTIFDVCTGQPVAVVETIQTITTICTDPNGCPHSIVIFNVHGSGVDPKGNTYQISDNEPIAMDNTNGAQNETTAIVNLHVISATSSDNLVVHETIHMTWDANGNLTSVVDLGSTSECTG